MTHFYLTLPSNSSTTFYPENTITNFVTRLHNKISLSEDWEVGLAEIIIPKSWFNVGKGENIEIHCNQCEKVIPEIGVRDKPAQYTIDMRIQAGYYESVETLVTEINSLISKNFSAPVEEWTQNNVTRKIAESEWPKFRYNALNRKVYVTVQKNMMITLSDNLATILGFADRQNPLVSERNRDTNVRSNRASDINMGLNAIYIYCDILEYVSVGDTQAPLLRIIDVEGKHGSTIHKIFDRPRYVPIQKLQFDSLELDLRDDFGKPIPFESGKLIVTLHFRKARSPYML